MCCKKYVLSKISQSATFCTILLPQKFSVEIQFSNPICLWRIWNIFIIQTEIGCLIESLTQIFWSIVSPGKTLHSYEECSKNFALLIYRFSYFKSIFYPPYVYYQIYHVFWLYEIVFRFKGLFPNYPCYHSNHPLLYQTI